MIGSYNAHLVLNAPEERDGLNRPTGSGGEEVFRAPVDAQDRPYQKRRTEGGVDEVGSVQVYARDEDDVHGLEPGSAGTLTWPDGDAETVRLVDVKRIDGRLILERQ